MRVGWGEVFYENLGPAAPCGVANESSPAHRRFLSPLPTVFAVRARRGVGNNISGAHTSRILLVCVFCWCILKLRCTSKHIGPLTTSQNCRPSHLRIRSYVGT
jgi:hypothetical protein